MRSWRFGGVVALTALCALAASGCGPGPGDRITYAVSYSAPERSPDCYSDNVLTSNVQTATIYVVALARDGDAYLAMGRDRVLEGNDNDSGYSFSGEEVIEQDNGGEIHRQTTTYTVKFDVDGDFIDGRYENEVEQSCTGCNTPATRCTEDRDLVGVEVDDVQIMY